jgi:hypothetical protein
MADGPGEATDLEVRLRALASGATQQLRPILREAADTSAQLRTALAEACDAIVEIGGPYALSLCEPDLDRWRALANPLFAENKPPA